jgi:hypothetical protein
LLPIANLKVFPIDCPTDIPPTNIEWTRVGPVLIPVVFPNGDTCWCWVIYCWRYFEITNPAIEVYVGGVGPVNPSCIENYSITEVFKATGKTIIKTNPQNFNWDCPDCPMEIINYRVYYEACYDQNNQPCYEGNTYCETSYTVCCENGIRIVDEISSRSIGNDCGEGCVPTSCE